MATPDIVANLRRRSSETSDLGELIEPALDLISTATNAEALAVVRATAPTWTVEAVRGVSASAVPTEVAAEALERDGVIRNERWSAAPLPVDRHDGSAEVEPPFVLLLRGSCAEGFFAAIVHALANAISIARRNERAQRRV